MTSGFRATHASVITLALMLGACSGGGGGAGGGGGISVTPAPPASTPTPTPSTSPTPSPTSSPTPTPTANTDLLGPLVTQTFANDAATGLANYSKTDGTHTANGTLSTVTVAYDQATGGYTITAGARTQVFLPSDLNAAQSNSAISVFLKQNGTTTDSLTLTKAGTTGRFTYRYVAGGFWQRTTDGASSVSGSLDAFAMGLPTTNAAVPVSGNAHYAIDIIGSMTKPDTIEGITGSGSLYVDFARGGLIATGTLINSTGGTVGDFAADARISSATNAFAGLFRLGSSTAYGTVNGRFYGPGADEIGGAFAINPSANNTVVGAILGRRSAATSANTDFNALITTGQAFSGDRARVTFTGSASTAMNVTGGGLGALTALATPTSIPTVQIPNYGLFTTDRISLFTATESRLSKFNAATYGSFTGTADGSDNISFYDLNGTKYVKAGLWYSINGNNYLFDNFTFGFDTAQSAMPRTGTGGYALLFNGELLNTATNTTEVLKGNGVLTANFATGAIQTSGSFTRLNLTGGSSFSGTATIASGANAFSGNFATTGLANATGNWAGRFYGPAADEVGATFRTSAANGSVVTGTLTGASDPSLANANSTLAGLASTTVLKGSDQMLYVRTTNGEVDALSDSNIDITYDPVAKTYHFDSVTTGTNFGSAVPIDVNLQPADVDTTRSEAGYTFFRNAKVNGKLLTFSASNPAIALTYMSFADLAVIEPGGPGTPTTQYLVHFGIPTPEAQIPKSGTASFTGIATGRGVYPTLARDVSIAGTSRFDVNFGASTWTAQLALTATDPRTGSSANLGTFDFNNGVSTITGNSFFGPSANNALFSGYFAGRFYGPSAAEYGANFQIDLPNTTGRATDSVYLWGIAVGKRP